MKSFCTSVSLPLRRLLFSSLDVGNSGLGTADSADARAAEAAREAKDRFHEQMPDSLRTQLNEEQYCLAPFGWNECVLGLLLGSGQFSDVFEVRSFRLADDPDLSAEEIERRVRMKKGAKHGRTKQARYALKRVRRDRLETHWGRIEYVQAVGDLALEREFLASLAHPHIIKLRGVARSGPAGDALILDCLVETLDQRMKRWQKAGDKSCRRASLPTRANLASLTSSFTFTSMVKSSSKSPSIEPLDDDASFSPRKSLTTVRLEPKAGDGGLRDRLGIALQISAAMKYLHSHSIVFRDLKPANIGFDARGDAKLFDFGLARFCPGGHGDAFRMSVAGTPRYMAPECLRGEAFGRKADVYSFAVVLWEILAGKRAYLFARKEEQLVSYVVDDNGRPDIDPCWPDAAKRTLERSFDAERTKRPGMEEVHDDLREALLSLQDSKDTLLLDHT